MEQEEQKNETIEGTPYWDNIGDTQLPFFNPTEQKKKEGLTLKFLTNKPRKQTTNKYNPNQPKPELWFDVEVKGELMTWTISQVSLLIALKEHEPIKDKTFDIKLVKVDDDFKKKNPKYKGKQRYIVSEATSEKSDGTPPELPAQ
jgi:hypothetical protein